MTYIVQSEKMLFCREVWLTKFQSERLSNTNDESIQDSQLRIEKRKRKDDLIIDISLLIK